MNSTTNSELHTLQETTPKKELGLCISNSLEWKIQVYYSVKNDNFIIYMQVFVSIQKNSTDALEL